MSMDNFISTPTETCDMWQFKLLRLSLNCLITSWISRVGLWPEASCQLIWRHKVVTWKQNIRGYVLRLSAETPAAGLTNTADPTVTSPQASPYQRRHFTHHNGCKANYSLVGRFNTQTVWTKASEIKTRVFKWWGGGGWWRVTRRPATTPTCLWRFYSAMLAALRVGRRPASTFHTLVN